MKTTQKMILIEQNRLSELNVFLENGWKVISTTPIVKCIEKYDQPFYGVYVVIEKETEGEIMKCRECSGRYKGYWASAPEADVCVNTKEPFEIVDVNAECVKRGHWEISFDGYYPYCSECGNEPDSGRLEDYCPKCGAKMDGDKNA